MTWFKVDDKSSFHRKIVDVGNEAWGAFCRAGAWSAEHLQNGRVPWSVALAIAPKPIWARLFSVRLCDPIDDAEFQIHDYLDWNPSREEVLKVRELRAASGRAGGKQRQAKRQAVAKQTPDPLPSKPQANAQTKINPVPVPVPIREEEDARAPAQESPYDLAWRLWTELWPGRYGERYVRGTDTGQRGDDRTMQSIGAKAATYGAQAEAVLRCKLDHFFACSSPWVLSTRHSPRAFDSCWNDYPSTATPDPAASTDDDGELPERPDRTPEQIAERGRWMDEQAAKRKVERELRAKIEADLARGLAAIPGLKP
jgi:hypothetical protein